jgi:hypothetical protein
MDANQQKLAQDIVNALSTSGRTDVPVVAKPEALPANADEKAKASYERHMDAHVAHLYNKNPATLTPDERTTLAQATLAGLQADGFCQ